MDSKLAEKENLCGLDEETAIEQAEDSYGEARYTTSENSIYSMNSYAVVQIVDSGVVAVEIRNPVTVQSISNPVRLLSLDMVKDIMLSQFEKNYDSFHLKGNFLKKMQLIYFRMTDREHKGCYSYVPVWRLSDGSIHTLPGDYQVIGMGDEIMINAVDGSVVRFSEEFMGEEAQEK